VAAVVEEAVVQEKMEPVSVLIISGTSATSCQNWELVEKDREGATRIISFSICAAVQVKSNATVDTAVPGVHAILLIGV
jgi:coenzyme F420-reducing hydrogenase gamma subunit